MLRRIMKGFMVLSMVVMVAGVGWAAIPRYINFQGRLMQNGEPMTGDVVIDYIISTNSHINVVGGIFIEEGVTVKCDENGFFNLEMGPFTDLSIFSDKLYVEIKVEGTSLGIDINGDGIPELRQPLNAVPYAYNAANLSGNSLPSIYNEIGEKYVSKTTDDVKQGKLTFNNPVLPDGQQQVIVLDPAQGRLSLSSNAKIGAGAEGGIQHPPELGFNDLSVIGQIWEGGERVSEKYLSADGFDQAVKDVLTGLGQEFSFEILNVNTNAVIGNKLTATDIDVYNRLSVYKNASIGEASILPEVALNVGAQGGLVDGESQIGIVAKGSGFPDKPGVLGTSLDFEGLSDFAKFGQKVGVVGLSDVIGVGGHGQYGVYGIGESNDFSPTYGVYGDGGQNIGVKGLGGKVLEDGVGVEGEGYFGIKAKGVYAGTNPVQYTGAAVFGESDETYGIGVWGKVSHNIGVKGEGGLRGVEGIGTLTGVRGKVNGDNVLDVGVKGIVLGTTGLGVVGEGGQYGVKGVGSVYGVWAEGATAGTGGGGLKAISKSNVYAGVFAANDTNGPALQVSGPIIGVGSSKMPFTAAALNLPATQAWAPDAFTLGTKKGGWDVLINDDLVVKDQLTVGGTVHLKGKIKIPSEVKIASSSPVTIDKNVGVVKIRGKRVAVVKNKYVNASSKIFATVQKTGWAPTSGSGEYWEPYYYGVSVDQKKNKEFRLILSKPAPSDVYVEVAFFVIN